MCSRGLWDIEDVCKRHDKYYACGDHLTVVLTTLIELSQSTVFRVAVNIRPLTAKCDYDELKTKIELELKKYVSPDVQQKL